MHTSTLATSPRSQPTAPLHAHTPRRFVARSSVRQRSARISALCLRSSPPLTFAALVSLCDTHTRVSVPHRVPIRTTPRHAHAPRCPSERDLPSRLPSRVVRTVSLRSPPARPSAARARGCTAHALVRFGMRSRAHRRALYRIALRRRAAHPDTCHSRVSIPPTAPFPRTARGGGNMGVCMRVLTGGRGERDESERMHSLVMLGRVLACWQLTQIDARARPARGVQ